jgi:coenzyme F420-dependent glucose-6-phosphate dehydrogenase
MTSTALGFHCSHEQHPPEALLRHAQLAAEAGFAHAMCSDHFHPWSERQAHSGYTWSWLGAALAVTPLSFGTVCAPGQRYHPAIIAQAVATLARMNPGRVWLSVGSGEALNEAITGEPWPDKAVRNARLETAVDIMRGLWAGETVTADGVVRVEHARLYDPPPAPPLIVGAALSPETARWMGRWADALITIATDRRDMQAIIDAFRDGGGEHKPLFLQVALAYAPSDAEAADAAFDQWRQCALPSTQLADLPTPAAFDAAAAGITKDDVVSRVRTSASIERHLDLLREDAAMGFERIYVHNVARDHQERFIEAIAPALADWR